MIGCIRNISLQRLIVLIGDPDPQKYADLQAQKKLCKPIECKKWGVSQCKI